MSNYENNNDIYNNYNKEIINNSLFQLNNEDSPQYLEYNSQKPLINYSNFHIKKNVFIKGYIFILLIFLSLYIFLLINFYKISKIIRFIDKKKMNNQINKNLINKIENNIKVCICTLGKKENRYIREFVQYYENYEIDQIILYDNNEIDGERFEEVIKDYIDKGLVKLIDWRGRNRSMIRVWNDCYLNNFDKFDWLIFYDIDEYIFLKNYTSIKAFLKEPKFKKCQKIYLNWVIHTDNNLIYYDNRTLHERFPEVELNARNKNKNCYGSVKSILKGHIPNVKINRMHIFSRDMKGCNGFGEEAELNQLDHIKNPDYEYYYIDHYYSKSVEEFIEKINKGDVYFENKISFKMHRIKRYFNINKLTKEKIKYIEKNTGLNLHKYKKRLRIKKL